MLISLIYKMSSGQLTHAGGHHHGAEEEPVLCILGALGDRPRFVHIKGCPWFGLHLFKGRYC